MGIGFALIGHNVDIYPSFNYLLFFSNVMGWDIVFSRNFHLQKYKPKSAHSTRLTQTLTIVYEQQTGAG